MPSDAASDRSAEPSLRASLRFDRGAFRLEAKLDLPARGVCALWGPSGSGKSTCLRLVAGLERGQGEVHVLGECWQDDTRGVFVPVHRRRVGYVSQDATLLEHLSVAQNLDYGRLRARGPARTERAWVVRELGLEALLDRAPPGLSGGERQRVAIAQALLAQPRLLLLDEPLAALDAARKADLLACLERLRDEIAIPMIYVSHAIDEVARLADHVVLLDGGRVAGSGPIGEALGRVDLPAGLADDAGAVIDATVVAHDEADHLTELAFAGGTLWVGRIDRPPGTRLRARAAARDVSIALERPGPSSILNVLPARVAEVRDAGPHFVTVRLLAGETALLARITRRSRLVLDLRPGLEVYAQVKGVALYA